MCFKKGIPAWLKRVYHLSSAWWGWDTVARTSTGVKIGTFVQAAVYNHPSPLHVCLDRRSFLSFEVRMSGTCNKRRRGLLLQRCTGSDRGSVETSVFDAVTFEDLTPVSFSQCLEPCKESWDLKENQCQDLCEVCHYHE